MNKSKLVYRSIKPDKNDNYLRIEIVEEESVALLTEGTLSMLIVKDLSDGQLFAISPGTFEKNFTVEKHKINESEDSESDDLIFDLLNTLEQILNSSEHK